MFPTFLLSFLWLGGQNKEGLPILLYGFFLQRGPPPPWETPFLLGIAQITPQPPPPPPPSTMHPAPILHAIWATFSLIYVFASKIKKSKSILASPPPKTYFLTFKKAQNHFYLGGLPCTEFVFKKIPEFGGTYGPPCDWCFCTKQD